MARILLIAYYYPPDHAGGGQRPLKMAKYLPRLGHDVVVLTSSYARETSAEKNIIRVYDPSHNKNRVGLRKFQWFFLRLAVEMLNRLGICTSIYSPWKRSVLRKANGIIARVKPQWILATYPPVETLEIGLHLSQKFNLPLIADFRDGLLFEAIESKRLRRFACVRKVYEIIESRVAGEAAALITVSEPLSRYFHETYEKSCVATVANGFDPDETQLRLPDIDLEPGCFHIVHSGRFSLSDADCSIALLVQAMSSILDSRPELERMIRLHLLGELSRKEKRMLASLVQRGVVLLHGSVSRPRALAFQRRADLLLLVTSPGRRSVATSKIFEYLQARRPILALTGRTFAAEIIEKSRCGWVVSPLSFPEIKDTLERLLGATDLDQRVDLSAAAIQDYSFTASLGQLHEILRAKKK